MNITQISLRDFRSWEHLDLNIEPGVSLLAGQNGAGKSSILEAALFAMYGATSDAGSYIRRGTDETRVTLWADTEGGVLTITRSVRRSGGKVAVRLDEVWLDGVNFTAATTSESQKALDAFLGVSREVLLASAFSTQHGGAAFTEAAPRDRKRVFSEVLALGMWDTLHDQAKAEQRDARAIAAAAKVRADQLDGSHERLTNAEFFLAVARTNLQDASAAEIGAESEATRLASEAEFAREARRERQAAVEAVDRARTDHQLATAARAKADEALRRAKEASANAPSVEDAKSEAERLRSMVTSAEATYEAESHASSTHAAALADARQVLADLTSEQATGSCARCGQALADASLPARLDEAAMTVDRLESDAPRMADPAALRAVRDAAQAAQTRLAEAETIELLAGSIDAFKEAARDAMDREMQTAETMRSTHLPKDWLEPLAEAAVAEAVAKHQDALEAATAAREVHRNAAADLARAEAAAQHAEHAAAEEHTARASLAEAAQREAVASILAAGFGPTGVPSLIIDNVLGQLADESNRVLAELGTPIRVDLRSQRVTQKGDLVDALDIIVLDGPSEAPYETLSGGERTRVALALRAALTRLLVAKSGARVRLLVVDEPSGLDAAGAEAFADVLQAFIAAGIFETCIVVTHDERLADRIDRVVRIEKSPGGASRLAESSAGSPPTFPGIPSGDPAEHTPEVVDA